MVKVEDKKIMIIKRDSRLVEFNKDKIVQAIMKAMSRTETGEDIELANKIADSIESKRKRLSVEEIQDIVEDKLMASARKDVAREYIRYRYKRQEEKNAEINLDKEIQGLFDLTSEEVRNNANKAGDKLQSYKAMVSDITSKDYAMRRIIPERFKKEHEKSIYWHDLNYEPYPIWNCTLINWMDMLDNGCNINGVDIETPKSIETAVALLSQIVAHVSSNCFGGVTLGRLSHLSKYGKKSLEKHRKIGLEEQVKDVEGYAWRRLEKEVFNACQGLEYEIQTLTNSRAEVPFLTVELDACDDFIDEEDRLIKKMIISSYLQVRIDGLTGGKTAVFPKLVFQLKKGVNLNPEDINYDLFKKAILCSSRRLYPDFLNYDKLVEVTGGYKPPMGCRAFLPEYINEKGERVTHGRFNQSVVSINLPRLAIQSKGSESKFYELLDKALELTRDSLMFRHDKLKGVKAKQAPILYQSGAIARLNPEDTIDHLLYDGYSSISIGYVGIYNAMKSLYGQSFFDTDELMNKAENVLQYMKDFADKTKEETNIGFSIYSTPAEVLATKFCKADIKEFGVIEGVNDKGYYENSFHYPSDKDITPFEKIDKESRYSRLATAGAIQYVEFGSMIHNTEALEEIVRYAYDKCHYFGVNVSSDRCFECNYVGEMKSLDETNNFYECPQCGNKDMSKLSVIRRLCGYLSSVNERPSVDNKMKEIHSRVKHFKEI